MQEDIMSVISYRTKMDRKFLEKAAVATLKYRSVNAFIDHAVEKALHDELSADTPVKKIAQEIEVIVQKYAPLSFRPATVGEEKEMLKDLEDYKSGKVMGIRVSRDFKPVGKRVGVH
jgi:hypothetical protein